MPGGASHVARSPSPGAPSLPLADVLVSPSPPPPPHAHQRAAPRPSCCWPALTRPPCAALRRNGLEARAGWRWRAATPQTLVREPRGVAEGTGWGGAGGRVWQLRLGALAAPAHLRAHVGLAAALAALPFTPSSNLPPGGSRAGGRGLAWRRAAGRRGQPGGRRGGGQRHHVCVRRAVSPGFWCEALPEAYSNCNILRASSTCNVLLPSCCYLLLLLLHLSRLAAAASSHPAGPRRPRPPPAWRAHIGRPVT